MTWDLFSSSDQARRVTRPDPRSGGRATSPGTARDSLGAAPREEWSVSEVNDAAKELLEGGLPPLWISGEVANFTRARSGHCYFTLRDDHAQLHCVMWRDEARRLPTAPDEGMAVRVLAKVTIYPSRGDFQAVVTLLEGKGEGLWKLALERLRRKLESEGLTSPARKRPLPRHPMAIGVVTSPSGAVFHDIVNVVRRRAPWTRVVLAGCRVQGEGAAREVATAIRRMGTSGLVDVMIVGRGGGSVEDLWAFNEEIVARAIAASPVPVISAVGHETDVTIADLVADLRAPTPSAAAESAVPDRAALIRDLERDGWRLQQAIATRLGRAQDAVDRGYVRLIDVGSRMTVERRERVRIAARQLESISPLGALARGFAVALGKDGHILRGKDAFVPGTAFDLQIADGSVACRVDDERLEAPPVEQEE
ncbi:MAG: exodeoxyribonuclease VII large subunit [Gemmatimonas sp.]|nr:exodeoxyribonuclease VII large subunit [Gemmatimonas sp.]